MIEILLRFRRSVREGNWELHLASSEQMIKWFFAYDHINYARQFTYYWASQVYWSVIHLDILREFQDGHFSVRIVPGKFNSLQSDQLIEQTVNTDQKGLGGIIGFAEGTVQWWILTSHVIAPIITDIENSLSPQNSENATKYLIQSRINFTEEKI